MALPFQREAERCCNFTLTSPSDLFDLTGVHETSRTVASDVSTYNVANVKLDTQINAQAAILTIDSALNQVNGIRAGVGAVQNRLQFTVNNLQIASENMSASESRIKDADFASEVATFTRNQIMVQAGVAMCGNLPGTGRRTGHAVTHGPDPCASPGHPLRCLRGAHRSAGPR